MANKQCIALEPEQFNELIHTIAEGYAEHRPNKKIAAALIIQRNTGMRISDIVKTYGRPDADGHRTTVEGIHLADIVKENGAYRLNVREKKTKKSRTFKVSNELYLFIQNYYIQNKLTPDAPMFDIYERVVQDAVKKCVDYLNSFIEDDAQKFNAVGTHSIRKLAATQIYEKTGHDINAACEYLQHSSPTITMRYLKVDHEKLNAVIDECTDIPQI